jgi:RND family efflux transporter MFP subunit
MKSLINLKSIAVFAVLLSIFISCNNQEKETEITGANDKIQKVEVVKPEQRSFKGEVLISGTARPNQIVTLYAMEGGMLIQMRKDIGDKVNRGDILAKLVNPVIDGEAVSASLEAQAVSTKIQSTVSELKGLKAIAEAMQSLYNRLRSTYIKTPALTPIIEVEKAKGEVLQAQAAVETMETKLQISKTNLAIAENKKKVARKRTSFLTISAPFNGIISKRFVDRGAIIQSGLSENNAQALFEIQEINPIRLTIPVPESDAVGIQKGMEVEVTLPELSGKSFITKVSRTSNVLDPVSKTMQVEIDLKNLDGKILSGMYAKVLLQIKSRENILSLPIMAKVSHKNENYVLAVMDGKVKRIPVKIGLSNQDYFEVLNNEITSETLVIIQGKGLVKPEQIVEPILKQE